MITIKSKLLVLGLIFCSTASAKTSWLKKLTEVQKCTLALLKKNKELTHPIITKGLKKKHIFHAPLCKLIRLLAFEYTHSAYGCNPKHTAYHVERVICSDQKQAAKILLCLLDKNKKKRSILLPFFGCLVCASAMHLAYQAVQRASKMADYYKKQAERAQKKPCLVSIQTQAEALEQKRTFNTSVQTSTDQKLKQLEYDLAQKALTLERLQQLRHQDQHKLQQLTQELGILQELLQQEQEEASQAASCVIALHEALEQDQDKHTRLLASHQGTIKLAHTKEQRVSASPPLQSQGQAPVHQSHLTLG